VEEGDVRFKVKSPEDFWAGVIFVAIGLFAIVLSWDYPMGAAFGMGPGFFPTWLGGLLMAFGIVIALLSLRLRLEPEVKTSWAMRPWLVLTGSLVAFGLMMQFEMGFVPSVLVLVAGSSLAHRGVHLREAVLVSLFLAAASVALFIYGLGLPFRLFWWSY